MLIRGSSQESPYARFWHAKRNLALMVESFEGWKHIRTWANRLPVGRMLAQGSRRVRTRGLLSYICDLCGTRFPKVRVGGTTRIFQTFVLSHACPGRLRDDRPLAHPVTQGFFGVVNNIRGPSGSSFRKLLRRQRLLAIVGLWAFGN